MSLEASWPFDVSEIRQEFSDIDTDGSGTISKVPFIYYVSKCRGEGRDQKMAFFAYSLY